MQRKPAAPGKVLGILKKHYSNAECALIHKNAYELLVATILSAQCTDVRVNMVTPLLFKKYPTPHALAGAELDDIKKIIRTTGFYNNKAKNIKASAGLIVEKFRGKIPQTMDELTVLPGVARKTANVVLGVWFKKNEGVVVDTHVLRVANRLGLTTTLDQKKTEQELMQKFPREQWERIATYIIHHGRKVCSARKPKCAECPLNEICPSAFSFE